MADIPATLQCAYCLRNQSHGGECRNQKFDIIGCLIFNADPKGCIRAGDFRLAFPLYHQIPLLNIWTEDWTINNVDTAIKITRIYGLSWDVKNGNLIVHCKCDYYVNEFHEDYVDPKNSPKLKLIK